MEHDLSLKKTIELKFEKKSVPIAKLPQVQNIFSPGFLAHYVLAGKKHSFKWNS